MSVTTSLKKQCSVAGPRHDGSMIDWPNLIVGAVLGFLLALILWMIDRRRAQRERVREAATAWMGAAKQIELATRPETTASELYLLRVSYPVDVWRSLLGPNDFLSLERLEGSYQQLEATMPLFRENPTPENDRRAKAALDERMSAFVAFSNMSRAMQDESYQQVLRSEERKRLGSDYLRYPIRTWRRERHNRRVRSLSVKPESLD